MGSDPLLNAPPQRPSDGGPLLSARPLDKGLTTARFKLLHLEPTWASFLRNAHNSISHKNLQLTPKNRKKWPRPRRISQPPPPRHELQNHHGHDNRTATTTTGSRPLTVSKSRNLRRR